MANCGTSKLSRSRTVLFATIGALYPSLSHAQSQTVTAQTLPTFEIASSHGRKSSDRKLIERRRPLYSGSGFPLVSGANGSAASPTRNTRHIVTPA
jgi:hypothetical protein